MVIDMHSHAVPLETIQMLEANPGKYGVHLQVGADGIYRMALPNGASFPLDKGLYDTTRRLADMDARGVDIEAVTPSPVVLFYNLPDDVARCYYRQLNDATAAMCGEATGRLIPCGALPVQDPVASCEELERIVLRYGTKMILLNTSVNGEYYDNERYLPLFSLCERLEVVVAFHPHHFNTSYGLAPYYLTNLLGNPVDTTVSAARLVLGGVMKACPALKVYYPHAGGFLPYQRGRIEHGFAVRSEARKTLGDSAPGQYFDRLYYDTLSHSGAALSFLVASQGARRVFVGSDYPYDMGDLRSAWEILNLPDLPEPDRRKIEHENAAALLGL